jgi:hypothetical protein
VTPDTKIELSEGNSAIAKVKVKDRLLTPFSETEHSELDKIMISEAKDVELISIEFDNGSRLRVSPNHTFISPEQMVVTAEQLTPGQLVLDKNRQPIAVANKSNFKYTGDLINVIVNKKLPGAKNHIVVTEGMPTGDWLLQSHNDSIQTGIDIRTEEIKLYKIE